MEQGCPTTTKIERRRTADGKLINQYLLIKRIGEGPHAKIKLARNTITNELVAIKKFSLYLLKKKTKQVKLPDVKHVSIVEDILRQLDIAKGLKHENVCRMLEVLNDEEGGKLYLVMEYCPKGEVAEWNQKKHKFEVKPEVVEETRLRSICTGMVRGLQFRTR